MSVISSPPTQTSLIELDETPTRKVPFYISKQWLIWIQAIVAIVQSAFQVLKTILLTLPQDTSIVATAIPLGSVSGGLYLVSWYARIVTPAGVSSSLTVNIGWSEGSVALGLSGAAITGNLTTSVQSGTILIQVDPNSSITYSTIYASNPATAMKYNLRIVVTRVA